MLRCSTKAGWICIFHFPLCKCGPLIHTALWLIGGTAVQSLSWFPWYLASASGALAEADFCSEWAQLMPGEGRREAKCQLVPPSSHPLLLSLDASSLLGPIDTAVGVWSRVVISPTSHWLIKSLLPGGSGGLAYFWTHYYQLGRAIETPPAFTGQEIEDQYSTQPCWYCRGREIRILSALGRRWRDR